MADSVEDLTVDEMIDARPLDTSARWADALRGDGPPRAEALVRLRAHLAAAAKFELDRRRITVDGAPRKEAASLVHDAAEAALAAILADLDRYRAQSAFTTWTAKYAIHEAAAAARRKTPWAPDTQTRERATPARRAGLTRY
jgi:hypothetical protein